MMPLLRKFTLRRAVGASSFILRSFMARPVRPRLLTCFIKDIAESALG